jgi:hypothetical protein
MRAAASAHTPIALLASAEAVAAIVFVIPRTMRIGATMLLAILAVAFVIHALQGEVASQLLLYAAVVAFVLVHGVPLRRASCP